MRIRIYDLDKCVQGFFTLEKNLAVKVAGKIYCGIHISKTEERMFDKKCTYLYRTLQYIKRNLAKYGLFLQMDILQN